MSNIDDEDLQHRLQAERDKRFKVMREKFIKEMLSEEKDDKPGGSTPSQYGLPPGAKDLQDLIEYRGMNFAQGNIFKAQFRSGNCSHSDQLRDARKTLWFAQREVDRLERALERHQNPINPGCCGHAQQQEDEEAHDSTVPPSPCM